MMLRVTLFRALGLARSTLNNVTLYNVTLTNVIALSERDRNALIPLALD